MRTISLESSRRGPDRPADTVRRRRTAARNGISGEGFRLGTTLALVVLVGFVAAPAAHAMQFNSTVRGKVTDGSGEPVDGVKVTITVLMQDPTRPRQPVEVESDEDGNYFARNVPTEWVTIVFEKEGLRTLTMERELRPGPNRIDVTMEVPEVPLAMRKAEAANEAYQVGLTAFQERDFDEAIRAMREARSALEGVEGMEEALAAIARIIGTSYHEQRDYEQAIAEFQTWAELAPDDASPHLALAQSYSMMGDMDASSQAFQKALALDPDDPMSHYNVGVTMINAAQVEEGIAELEKAIELQPVYPLAHKNLGYAYARLEQYQKAIDHFQLYLEQEPEAADRAEIEQFIVALRELIGG